MLYIDIKSSLEKLQSEYKDENNRFFVSYCDVTNIESIEKCIDKINQI